MTDVMPAEEYAAYKTEHRDKNATGSVALYCLEKARCAVMCITPDSLISGAISSHTTDERIFNFIYQIDKQTE